jgi:hypothetical protein
MKELTSEGAEELLPKRLLFRSESGREWATG